MSNVREGGDEGMDEVPTEKWPRWKVVGVYVGMFGLAVWSIWMIDSHVLQVAAEAGR